MMPVTAAAPESTTDQILLPSAFVEDPAGFLALVASQPTSRHGLAQLSGPVASWFAALSAGSEQVANVYLQAAAVQLRDIGKVGDVEQEMQRTQQHYEVLEAVCIAAAQCVSRRMAVTSSGILATLAHISMSNVNELHHAQVAFLQCALLAEQYRYASRLIEGTWPRPNSTVSVKLVLRYYYLRGMIHLGCNDYVMSHRCFWTCLSVPAEVCSKIMIEAWKKMILVQCLLGEFTAPALPKSVPSCLTRLLSSSKESPLDFSGTKRPRGQPQSSAVQPINCYMDLAEAFYSRDRTKFEAIQAEQTITFNADGNFGLIKQCHSQLLHKQLEHFSKLYSVVPLTKLADLLTISVDQVARTLCQSQVLCEIQDDGMVVFSESTTSSPAPTVDLLEWMHLLERVRNLDVDIVTTAKYHSLLRKESSSGDTTKTVAAGPRGVEDF